MPRLKEAQASRAHASDRELEVGARIPQALLNGHVPDGPMGVDIGAISSPSRRIGGDFFYVFPHSSMVVDVVLGDVMGKGIPAALLSAATKSQLLRALSTVRVGSDTRLLEPETVISLLHRGLADHLLSTDSFLAMTLCRFDVTRRLVTIVDCGHTAAIHIHSDGRVSLLKGDNLPLGVATSERYLQKEHAFSERDVFVIYSDGATEARSPRGEMFGVDRLTSVARSARDRPATEIVKVIHSAIVSFCRTEAFSNDFICLAVAIPPHADRRELHLTSSLESLSVARSFVRLACAQKLTPAIHEDSVHLLQLAIDEAFTNALVHSYDREPGHPIDLAVELGAEEVVLELRHRGRPFTPSGTTPPNFDGSRDGGFGLHLIRHCVDDLVYLSEATTGDTIVRMRKKIVRR